MKKSPVLWFVPSLIAVCLLASCGGGGSSGPANLQIQLMPLAPSLAVNSSVLISAQTDPAMSGNFGTMTWSVQGSSGCTEGVVAAQNAPPLSPCPNGWVAWEITPPPELALAVYYFAPATTGTYQVNVQGQIMNSTFTTVTYQGSASATVTVTAQ